MMDHLAPILLAWSIQLTGVLSPGPSVALILGIATAQGRGPALMTAFGIGSGSVVLALATVIGITAIFAQVAELMTLVRLLGAAYLAWLSYGAFKKAINPPPLTIADVPRQSPARLWSMGFVMQIANPKAIMFWLAIASLGGIGAAPPAIVALFVLGAFVNSVVGHGAWAFLLSSPPVRRVYQSARRWVEATLGAIFGVGALSLVTARTA